MIRFNPLAIALGATILAAGAANAQISTSNLLLNGGAETGTIANWTAVTSGGTPPGVDNGSFDSGINPHTGLYDFYGGTEALGTLTQTVSLVGTQGITSGLIDSGVLTANVSFFEQSLAQGSPDDDANITLNFFNGSSTLLSSVTTATIDSTGAWKQGTGGFLIPVGARSIGYQINFIRNVGSDNDSFVDDNSLTVSGGASAAAAPEPTSLVLAGTGLFGLVGAVIRRRRVCVA